MGNFLASICTDSEYINIINELRKIERLFQEFNLKSKLSMKYEEKFEILVQKIKNPDCHDIESSIHDARRILSKLKQFHNDDVQEIDNAIKNLYILIGNYLVDNHIRKKHEKINSLKKIEIKLLKDCSSLMNKYQKSLKPDDPFLTEMKSEIDLFRNYMSDIKNMSSKSYFNEITRSVDKIDKNSLKEITENKNLTKISNTEKTLDGINIKNNNPITRLENTLLSKIDSLDKNKTSKKKSSSLRSLKKLSESNSLDDSKLFSPSDNISPSRPLSLFKNISQKNTKQPNSIYSEFKNIIQKNDTNTDLDRLFKLEKKLNPTRKVSFNTNISPKQNNKLSNIFSKIENELEKKNKLDIVKSCFKGKDKIGDFEYEIKENLYPKTLYIFHDNLKFHKTSKEGENENSIRKYNKYGEFSSSPRSAGITIGYDNKNPFTELTPEVKNIINEDIEEIQTLLSKHNFNTLKYTISNINDNIPPPIKEYILSSLENL